ncbi:ubiquitin-related domain-containing protein [Xylaria digitata]|nr:ubiquitin-related domain-containing protein [Xylaria digitata]
MSDRAGSPRHGRGDSPPSRTNPRNNARSRSPPRNLGDRSADHPRRRDDYRSRDHDDKSRGSRDQWRDRRSRDEDRSDRRHHDNEEAQPDRRDRYRDSDERPDRDRSRPKKSFGGFKYKEKRRDDGDDRDDNRRGGSHRGYRNRSPSPRRRGYDRDEPASSSKKSKKSADADTSKPPTRAPAAPVASGEEMIIVHVNDRLGTKAAIPCFASDRIKEFKIMVAARIGREPHEILLKRQGQRPFKDILTLADYEISNGVQLDLEVDTGD